MINNLKEAIKLIFISLVMIGIAWFVVQVVASGEDVLGQAYCRWTAFAIC